MMDWGELIKLVLPIAVTFVLGLLVNKPGYKKAKNIVNLAQKTIADDKLDSTELEEWADLFKKDEPE